MKDSIIVTTPAELRELVTEAVEAAMQKAGAPSKDAPADILNCEQVAELIRVHPGTVPKLATRRGLPVYGRVGTHLRFRRADVLTWLARKKS